MKFIVISSSSIHKGETELVSELFDNGLEIFHLRKPRVEKAKMKAYLDEIPNKYYDRIVLHSNYSLAASYKLGGIHLSRRTRRKKLRTWFEVMWLKMRHSAIRISTSFHSIETLSKSGTKYEYVFLSPIFNSISKDKAQAKFVGPNLSAVFDNSAQKVIALGGIEASKIEEVGQMGFSGAAALGAIWSSDNPVQTFLEINEKCKNQDTVLA